jgi:hypothetical protein
MQCNTLTFVGMPSHGNLPLDGFKLNIPLYAAGIDTDLPELIHYLFCIGGGGECIPESVPRPKALPFRAPIAPSPPEDPPAVRWVLRMLYK